MEAGSVAKEKEARPPASGLRWRLWALVPIVLLVAVVSVFAATGGSIVDLLGRNPPPADEFDVARVEFKPGEIRIKVRNPQPEDLTIAAVSVDDMIVPYELDGPQTLGRLGGSTIIVPFDWVEDDPYLIGVTSSTGIETATEVPAAILTEGATVEGFLGYALIGFLVGVVPVALGLAWLPSLRRASPKWIAAFMALTAGLLTFLAFDALAEALELQAVLPGALQGVGLVVLGVAVSYLALSWIGQWLSRRGAEKEAAGTGLVAGAALSMLVAIGIGLHNFGEGLAIGSSFALGSLALGSFLIIGFMVHNITEGLGIAAPIAKSKVSLGRLVALCLIAGAPAILGAWVGGFLTNEVVGVLFFAIAVGAALQVVVEVGRYVHQKAPGGLTSGYAIGGFLAGLLIMYLTGLLI
jgi:zinc transporter ZupT